MNLFSLWNKLRVYFTHKAIVNSSFNPIKGDCRVRDISLYYWRVLLTIAFFILTRSVLSQTSMSNYNIRQGLPSNQVLLSYKDSLGFVWLATDNGICRYDGDRFKLFRNEFSKSGLRFERIITQFFQLQKDTVFLVSVSGKILIYDYYRGVFSDLNKSRPYLEEKYITGIFVSSQGGLWLTTETGLIKTDRYFGFIEEFQIKDKVKGPENSNMVNSLFEDKNGNLWLAMFYRGIMIFNCREKEFSKKGLEELTSNIQVKQITGKKNDDYIYAATNGEGVIKINVNSLEYKKYKFLKSSIPSDQVNSISLFKDSLLFIGTRDGIGVLNLESDLMDVIQHNDDKPNSLTNNYVHHLMSDNQDIVWISTFGGLSKLLVKNSRFIKIAHNRTKNNTPSSNIINFIYVDKYENLWLGTSKGINIKNIREEKYYRYLLPKDSPLRENEEMVNLFEDKSGYIWVGTWGGGISRTFLPSGFKAGDKLDFTNFYSDTSNSASGFRGSSISSNFIRYITEDNLGNILISTWNGGLNFISSEEKYKAKPNFKHFRKTGGNKDIIASDYLSNLIFDNSNNLWVVTGNGLQRVNIQTGISKMLIFPDSGVSEKESALNKPTTIIKSKDNCIWHGTFGGLIKISELEKEKPKYEVIYKDENRGIYSILEDAKGKIWFSTINSEIGVYNPKTKNIRFYNMIEEVNGFDFYFGYPFIDKNGYAYFNGNSGYLMFNTNQFSINRFVPNVFISSIKVDGKSVSPETDISRIKTIELGYQQKLITVRFAALNFVNSEFNKYKYMLEKYDNKWYQLDEGNELNFSNLDYGEYILKIIGSNNDGVWNYKPTYLKIIVNPPFWGTIYSRIIFISFLILSVFYFFNRKIRKLKEERERQNYFSKLLIESQEEERKRLSKELHDSLGQNLLVVKNWLVLYQNSEIKDQEDLNKITELVSDSISEVREISSNLHPHQLERLGLNKAVLSMVKKLKETGSINIKTELDDISGKLSKDKEINIFRIIQESLNNIFKHSKADSANLVISLSESYLKLIIEDNGIGFSIDKAGEGVTSSSYPDKGLGLHSIRERAKFIGADLSISSSEKGTKIELGLKI